MSNGAFLAPGAAKRIRCKACGWTARVAPGQAGPAILYHRDVLCPNKRESAGPRPVTTKGRMRAPRRQRVGAPKRSFCPTCRGELSRTHDTLVCIAGCTGIAM